MALEDYYEGDEAWKVFLEEHAHSPRSLERYCGNEHIFSRLGLSSADQAEILTVAISLLGIIHVRRWLVTPIPALGQHTPIECMRRMAAEPAFRSRMRVYLMRFPA